MSEEVFSILKRLDMDAVEVQTSLQCAPILTGIKMSNLLHVRRGQEQEVFRLFENSPISCHVLYRWDNRVSILLYRRAALCRWLEQKRVRQLMEQFGYCEVTFEEILERMAERYQDHVEGRIDFPHEVGLLLGYPPEDVIGFIENEGRNCKLSGYWKVYGDPDRAHRIFTAYDRARDAVIRLAGNGLGVTEIMSCYNIMKRKQLFVHI